MTLLSATKLDSLKMLSTNSVINQRKLGIGKGRRVTGYRRWEPGVGKGGRSERNRHEVDVGGQTTFEGGRRQDVDGKLRHVFVLFSQAFVKMTDGVRTGGAAACERPAQFMRMLIPLLKTSKV